MPTISQFHPLSPCLVIISITEPHNSSPSPLYYPLGSHISRHLKIIYLTFKSDHMVHHLTTFKDYTSPTEFRFCLACKALQVPDTCSSTSPTSLLVASWLNINYLRFPAGPMLFYDFLSWLILIPLPGTFPTSFSIAYPSRPDFVIISHRKSSLNLRADLWTFYSWCSHATNGGFLAQHFTCYTKIIKIT